MKSYKSVAIGAAFASSLWGACSPEQTAPPNRSQPAVEATPSHEPLAIETLQEHAIEAWIEGIKQERKKFQDTGKLGILYGQCAWWKAQDGFTIVKNPGLYIKEDSYGTLAAFVFLGPVSGRDPSEVALMNGGYTYIPKGDDGRDLNEEAFQTHGGLILNPKGLGQVFPLEVKAVIKAESLGQSQFNGPSRSLFDQKSGEPILETRVVAGVTEEEIPLFCEDLNRPVADPTY